MFTDSFTQLLEKPKLSEYRLEEVAHGVAGSTPVAIYRVTIETGVDQPPEKMLSHVRDLRSHTRTVW